MKSLHICYISQEYPPETGWGGVGAYTYEMAHALAAAGKRVTVITRALGNESVTTKHGVEVHRVSPRPTWDNIPFFWRLNRVWPGFAWSAMLRLRQIQRQNPVDVIEAAEVRADGFFVSLMPRRPKLITRLHTAQVFVDSFNSIPQQRVRPWNYWFEKKAISRANLITAPTKAVLNLTRTWLPLAGHKTLVVPNPIDENKFQPAAYQRRNLIVYTGRLERRKGVHVIAAAIPEVLKVFPAAEFLFLGSDDADFDGVRWSEKLRASIESHQRNQLRFEHKSREGLVRAYQQATVCVLPSVWENFPYASLEAMACGAPVIASECGGFPELIENGVSGFLIPVNDANALASRIIELLATPALAERIGQNARHRVETLFSARQVVPNMIAAYEGAVACA